MAVAAQEIVSTLSEKEEIRIRAEELFFRINELSPINQERLMDVLVLCNSQKVIGMTRPEWFESDENQWDKLLNETEEIPFYKIKKWFEFVDDGREIGKLRFELRKILNGTISGIQAIEILDKYNDSLESIKKQWDFYNSRIESLYMATYKFQEDIKSSLKKFRGFCFGIAFTLVEKRIVNLYNKIELLSSKDRTELLSMLLFLRFDIDLDRYSEIDKKEVQFLSERLNITDVVSSIKDLESRIEKTSVMKPLEEKHKNKSSNLQQQNLDSEIFNLSRQSNPASLGAKAKRAKHRAARETRKKNSEKNQDVDVQQLLSSKSKKKK